MNEHFYIPFEKFILRTPIFPFDRIYKADYDSPLFEEALYIASPDLYNEKIRTAGASAKIDRSLYKYYSRAASRSTPFGLFAACSIGTTNSENDNCLISEPENLKRHTRLDMNFLCALIQYLESLSHIQKRLIYYTNDSLYSTGDKLRYVEYYFKGLKKIHQIQEISKTDYIEKILSAAKSGNNISALAHIIVDKDITIDEATDFIKELISNQLLKSELEANLTGEDVLSHTIKVLQNINEDIPELKTLVGISKTLNEIDKNLYHDETLYRKLFENIDSFNINYDNKYLIQTDTFRNSNSYLSKQTINELNSLLSFLAELNYSNNNKRIDDFVKAFSERYEEQEVPLLEVLDSDIGIGYPVGLSSDCINPLLEDIISPSFIPEQFLKLTPGETLIVKKFHQNALKGSEFTESIYLDDNDIKTEKVEINKLVPTCNVMFQIIKDEKKKENYYIVKAVGGATAASLLGRFCYLNNDILNLVCDICKMEQKALPEGIVAEIVHLPDTRIGNIAFRPVLRMLDVHYLAHSGAKRDMSIPASDLVLGLKYGKLYIKSTTLNKIIFPRLSNAHNYSNNGLPVYQFLCDMQTYGLRSPSLIYIENILNNFDYVPRIYYKNFILSPKTWIIYASQILKDGAIDFSHLREKRIPKKILVKNYDNELFIDLALPSCRDVFIDMLRKRKKIIIEEFLYNDKSSVITDGKANYCGEFIVPFYKK